MCIVEKQRQHLVFLANFLLSNKLGSAFYFPTKAPCLRITCDGERERCQMPFTSVAYTVSDSVLSLETTFPFSDGLAINANQILIINM